MRARIAALVLALTLAAPPLASPASGRTDPALTPHTGPIPYSRLVARPHPKPKPKLKPKPAAHRPLPGPAKPHPAARTAAAAAHGPAKPTVAGALAAPPAPRPGARLTPAQPIPPEELDALVDGAVHQAMADDHIVGAAVSIVQDGRIVMERGYGAARLGPPRPVDPRATLFRLGSVSKLFTWLAVLGEVERGRMGLDRPVDDYLPRSLRIAPEGFDRPVLLRHLLTHTAGFEDRQFGRLLTDDPTRLRGPQAALLHDRPRRVRPAGELASYSNDGAALAGAALAEVEHKPFEAVIEQALTGPLGMTHTSFREPYPADLASRADGLPAPLSPALAEAEATGHLWSDRGGWRALPFEYGADLAPAVGASSTADDMARLMTAMLGGGTLGGAQVYGPATAQALRTPLQRTTPGLNGWPGGLMATRLPGEFEGYGHDGATLGFRAALTLVPDLQLGVFIAADSDTAGPLTIDLAGRIVGRFYAPPPTPPPAGLSDPASARGRYDGDYLSSMRAYHGPEGFVDRLERLAHARVGDDGLLTVAMADRGRVFAPETPAAADGRFRAVDGEESLVFAPATGRAAAFTPASNRATYERVGWPHEPVTLLIASLLAAAAALLTLAGVGLRFGREARRTAAQTVGSLLQSFAALAWLASLGAYGVWRAQGAGAVALMLHWPSPWLIGASWGAVAALLISFACAVQLPQVWRGDRRIPGWSTPRKLRHSFTATLFLAFAALLAAWGALEPWSA